jgi:hypothetical protein
MLGSHKGNPVAEQTQAIQCHHCGGTELYNTVLSARNGVIIGRKMPTGDEWMLVHCLICLTCGTIMPYINAPDVERLRTWAYAGAAPTDYPSAGQQPDSISAGSPADTLAGDSSNPAVQHDVGRGFGTIVILCIIVGVMLGLAGVFYGLMNQ